MASADIDSVGSQIDRWLVVQPDIPGTVLWIGPMWAAVCGLVASGRWTELDWTRLAFALVAALLSGPVLGGIGALALSLGDTLETRRRDVQHADEEQRTWLPYTTPHSSSARLSHSVNQIRGRWAQQMRTPAGQYAVCMAVAAALAVTLSALIGGRVLALIVAGIAWSLALGIRGQSQRAGRHWLLFGFQVTLGWLLGHATLGAIESLSYALSATLGATYWAVLSAQGSSRGRRLSLSCGFQLLGALLLVFARAPAPAGAVLLLLVAQFLFRTDCSDAGAFGRRVQPLIALQVLIVSIALGRLK